MKKLEFGSVTSPSGFQAAGISAGMKKSGSRDLGLIYSETPCLFSGAFTNNSFSAAPVIYCKQLFQKTQCVRAIVINSGNANSCTGEKGLQNTAAMAAQTAKLLSINKDEVFVSSTGRIGVQLDMGKIEKGIELAVDQLSIKGGIDAAKAILTTDNAEKSIAITTKINDEPITIGGIAKGAGMLFPRLTSCGLHATMLAYITTDAVLEPEAFKNCLHQSLDQSFNRISVDGDTSTNDSFIALANGKAGNSPIKKGTTGEVAFQEAFNHVAGELARMMVLDGEGATKFVELAISGAKSAEEARKCAETIANSLLCKTAWFGSDPNWGRLIDAIGYSGVEVAPEKLQIKYDTILIMKDGIDTGINESERTKVLKKPEFSISIDLGIDNGSFTFWTCDLSYDYIKINAEYRT